MVMKRSALRCRPRPGPPEDLSRLGFQRCIRLWRHNVVCRACIQFRLSAGTIASRSGIGESIAPHLSAPVRTTRDTKRAVDEGDFRPHEDSSQAPGVKPMEYGRYMALPLEGAAASGRHSYERSAWQTASSAFLAQQEGMGRQALAQCGIRLLSGGGGDMDLHVPAVCVPRCFPDDAANAILPVSRRCCGHCSRIHA